MKKILMLALLFCGIFYASAQKNAINLVIVYSPNDTLQIAKSFYTTILDTALLETKQYTVKVAYVLDSAGKAKLFQKKKKIDDLRFELFMSGKEMKLFHEYFIYSSDIYVKDSSGQKIYPIMPLCDHSDESFGESLCIEYELRLREMQIELRKKY